MNFEKNKSAIIAIVVLLVVCAGTFFGVRAMNNKLDNTTTGAVSVSESGSTTSEASTSIYNSTTAASTINSNDTLVPTTLPMATTNALAQVSQSTTGDSEIITTYPMVPTNNTTTTKAQSNAVVTTKASTTKATTATTKDTTQSTTSVTQSVTQGTTGENGAVFDEGLAGYLYNPDGNYYYTNTDPWQRALGYNEFYDLGAGFVSIYMDTIRFKFEYADKDWLIQFWKGQYGFLFVGHEIGVYTKPKDREVEHYDAATENDENALYMSMTGYRDGQEIYSREYAKYWWCTGFVPGKLDNYSDRSELSLKCRITMKDQAMLEAFTKSLQQSGLVLDKDYTVSGLDVFITW